MAEITRVVFSTAIWHSGVMYYTCDVHMTEHGIKFNGTGGTNIAQVITGNTPETIQLVSPFQPDPAMCPFAIRVDGDGTIHQAIP